MAKRCPKRSGAETPRPAPAKGQASPAKRPKRRTSAPTAHYGGLITSLDERQLDATTGYAHSSHKNGQFGSHAAHDDYGEGGMV